MNSMSRWSPLVAATAVLLLVGAASASACPTCKLALETNSGEADLVSAYMYSILFMMAMPFTLVAGFAAYMYLLVRRARVAQTQAPMVDQHR